MRCAVGERGVRIEMEPEDVVRRTEGGWDELLGFGGSRRRFVGKDPVWKEEWWSRRWPERDLGSMGEWKLVLSAL